MKNKKNNQEYKKIKIALVTSKGGHLFQVYQLQKWWCEFDHFWITFKGEDSLSLLQKEKVFFAFFPETRNIKNALKNFFLGLKIIRKERPNLLFSCGAGIAPPIFLAGKILGCKLVFMETYDFISFPSLSSVLLKGLVDKFIVQHQEQKKFFKKAEFWGASL